MHWLTDSPETTGVFLPDAAFWSPLRQEYPVILHRLSNGFNEGRSTWVAQSTQATAIFADRCMVIIDQAPASQFDAALTILKQGGELPDGLICLALTGSGFRGQRQRPWSAVRGNLHLTAHYHLHHLADEIQAALTMIPAIAAAESIAHLLPNQHRPGIKWINDIYLSGRKVAGVLTATQVTGRDVDCAVFGIGINVEHAPEVIPTPFVPAAGCLVDSVPGLTGTLPVLFQHVVNTLDELVTDLKFGRVEEIFSRYRKRADFIGEKVRIWPEGTEDWKKIAPVYRGRISALHSDLSLMIEGNEQPVRSGRLAYESACIGLLPEV